MTELADRVEGLMPRETTPEMREAGVELALRVQLGSGYTWGDYMDDLWKVMFDAALRARKD